MIRLPVSRLAYDIQTERLREIAAERDRYRAECDRLNDRIDRLLEHGKTLERADRGLPAKPKEQPAPIILSDRLRAYVDGFNQQKGQQRRMITQAIRQRMKQGADLDGAMADVEEKMGLRESTP